VSGAAEPGEPDGAPVAGRLHAALLLCEVCGTETPHRILHLERARAGGAGAIRGVARCRTCGHVHPFSSVSPARAEAQLIVSEAGRSERHPLVLPAATRVTVGAPVPEWPDPLVVRKVDDRRGRSVSSARGDDVRTVWAVRDSGPSVLFSFIEGRTTRSGRLPLPPGTWLEVGMPIALPLGPATIVGLRARRRTWRRPGDRFVVGDVQRVYARRNVRPPAGNIDWSRDRERPDSRASSTSRSPRRRSSPGVRTNRSSPRARTADGGATVHRSSPS
jgi:uncharacterized Zn finger protein